MSEHRDTTVADALRRLDVPDHAPGFWDRLDARLAEPADVAAPPSGDEDATTGAEVVELGSAPSRRRGRRGPRPILALVAAAAAVVALVVGIIALRPGGDDESRLDSADQRGEQDGAPDTPTTEQDQVDDAVQTAELAAAEQAAVAWLTALSEGDVEGAHAMLDAASRAQLPLEDFRMLASGLAEGAAAFHDVDTRHVVTVEEGAAPFWVATFVGEVEREGTVQTDAFPVVVVDEGGQPRVAFELTELDVRPAMGASVDVQAAPGATVVASVDGAPASRVVVDADGRGSLDAALPGPARGPHALTVVAVSDGRPVARAVVLSTTLDVAELPLQPADAFTSATPLEERADDLIGAYSLRAAPGGDGGLCFEVETGDGVFGGPCLGTPGFGELVTPEGTRLLVGNISDPAARAVVVTVDGDEHEVALSEVAGSSARSFALRVDGEVESVSVLDDAGDVLASESR